VERDVVGRARTATVVGALALAGCYDMEALDPGPASPYLLIDDFEDAPDDPYKLASAAQFKGAWKAYPFNADNNPGLTESLEFVGGNTGGFALAGRFRFIDPNNQDFTGVNVGVTDARPLLDARFFEAIQVSIRFDQGSTPFPTNTHFYVQLGCDSAPALGTETSPFWVHAGLDDVTNDWKTLRVPISNFSEPQESSGRIDGGAAACLARVDSVRITVATHMRLEDPVTGSLYLDDVSFD
jgi:hypothetical protein